MLGAMSHVRLEVRELSGCAEAEMEITEAIDIVLSELFTTRLSFNVCITPHYYSRGVDCSYLARLTRVIVQS